MLWFVKDPHHMRLVYAGPAGILSSRLHLYCNARYLSRNSVRNGIPTHLETYQGGEQVFAW